MGCKVFSPAASGFHGGVVDNLKRPHKEATRPGSCWFYFTQRCGFKARPSVGFEWGLVWRGSVLDSLFWTSLYLSALYARMFFCVWGRVSGSNLIGMLRRLPSAVPFAARDGQPHDAESCHPQVEGFIGVHGTTVSALLACGE